MAGVQPRSGGPRGEYQWASNAIEVVAVGTGHTA